MKSMSRKDLDALLMQTLDDQRMSRGERRSLRAVFEDLNLDDGDRAVIRSRIFDLARDRLDSHDARAVLDWAEDAVKLLQPIAQSPAMRVAAVHFSPGEQCRHNIRQLLDGARASIDICVFTITDNQLARPIRAAHERGVAVRVITDNDKAYDAGSDVDRLADFGVPVRVDKSEHHMHHKFAIFDRRTLVTGSYNWTRSAAMYNRENIIVSDEPKLVDPFQRSFDELWETLA